MIIVLESSGREWYGRNVCSREREAGPWGGSTRDTVVELLRIRSHFRTYEVFFSLPILADSSFSLSAIEDTPSIYLSLVEPAFVC